MKLFSCRSCGQPLYFENVRCEGCGRALGYLPDLAEISALEPSDTIWNALMAPDRTYKFCENYQAGVCNWMIPAEDNARFCAACRHNRVIPDLSIKGNDVLWRKIEVAKHRLFYSLLRFGLPLENRIDNSEKGLAFDFLADPSESHAHGVMTGHANGLITLALKEADDVVREKVRGEMGEPYRTLLGHFRHESGHYFWERLVANGKKWLNSFRSLFGDERANYGESLERHYSKGAPTTWQNDFVSAYAACHPWEDFAETWAHYLHIVDALETAGAFGLKVKPSLPRARMAATVNFDPYNNAHRIKTLIDAWLPIEFATNSLNRSLGQMDIYPFVLSPNVIEKLGFVHALIRNHKAKGLMAHCKSSDAVPNLPAENH